ncbi:inner membrane protein YiaA [Actinomycetota bacterium]
MITPTATAAPAPTAPTTTPAPSNAPTVAFAGASWAALLVGGTAYLIGLFNASMPLAEKGYYLTLLLFGLFAAVSVQKAVRDKMEGIEVTALYLGLAWAAVAAALSLVTIGLWNADLARSEKGFFGMAFTLAMYAAVAVQKNVRDQAIARRHEPRPVDESPRRWSLSGLGD